MILGVRLRLRRSKRFTMLNPTMQAASYEVLTINKAYIFAITILPHHATRNHNS